VEEQRCGSHICMVPVSDAVCVEPRVENTRCAVHGGHASNLAPARRGLRALPAAVLLPVVMLVVVGLLLPEAKGECASNPKSKQTCSGDRMIQMEGSSPLVSWPRPAGVCGTGTDTNGTKTTMCACQPGYTAGLACEYITRAGRFDHEHDTTLNTSGMLDMSDWRYLAKTCWGPQVEGLQYLEVTFVTAECVLRNCSIKGQGVDYRNRDLPEIMFYASYDNSFSLANMAAATRVARRSLVFN
jgi:hypothetical protein